MEKIWFNEEVKKNGHICSRELSIPKVNLNYTYKRKYIVVTLVIRQP